MQHDGVTGKVTFSVHAIADLDADVIAAIKRYRFATQVLYTKRPLDISGTTNPFKVLGRIIWYFIRIKKRVIRVKDLVEGRTINCKDVVEMLAVEDEIREAAQVFANILRAAAWFGGEEMIEL